MAVSRRDEVWEMKRQRFLNRQGSGSTGHEQSRTSHRHSPPPISTSVFGGGSVEEPLPNSPLSQLVQSGFPVTAAPQSPPNKQNNAPNAYGMGCPPALPGSRGSASRQDSFDAGVAKQWSGNVQSTVAQHQQQNDPNYAGRYQKPQGYRVTHAPGGGSSISLSWGGDGGGETGTSAPSRGAANYRSASPSYAAGAGNYRSASPSHAAGAGNYRSASPSYAAGRGGGQRSASPFAHGNAGTGAAACFGGGSGAESRYNAGGGGGSSRPPMPMPRDDSREFGAGAPGGNGVPQGFGARVDARSANAFACGQSQNTGNYISDRRTTRVSRPPGGSSQISFG